MTTDERFDRLEAQNHALMDMVSALSYLITGSPMQVIVQYGPDDCRRAAIDTRMVVLQDANPNEQPYTPADLRKHRMTTE